MSAAGHRQRAGELAAAGDYSGAILESVRAIGRELEERGVLDPRLGRTAAETAGESARALPGEAAALRDSARLFDDVCYGGRPGTADGYAAVRDLDARIAAAGPGLAAQAASGRPRPPFPRAVQHDPRHRHRGHHHRGHRPGTPRPGTEHPGITRRRPLAARPGSPGGQARAPPGAGAARWPWPSWSCSAASSSSCSGRPRRPAATWTRATPPRRAPGPWPTCWPSAASTWPGRTASRRRGTPPPARPPRWSSPVPTC